jgi:hypothetical protein
VRSPVWQPTVLHLKVADVTETDTQGRKASPRRNWGARYSTRRPEIAREMTTRRISEVPSKIV